VEPAVPEKVYWYADAIQGAMPTWLICFVAELYQELEKLGLALMAFCTQKTAPVSLGD
jgi:hypothetical protein